MKLAIFEEKEAPKYQFFQNSPKISFNFSQYFKKKPNSRFKLLGREGGGIESYFTFSTGGLDFILTPFWRILEPSPSR